MDDIIAVCPNCHYHFHEDMKNCPQCPGPDIYQLTRYTKVPLNGRTLDLITKVAQTAAANHIPRLLAILDKKQMDYGPANITRHGQLGVIVRMDDKLARLQNLLANKTLPHNESISDSWDDLANYGIIGAMLAKGDWPKF